MATLVNSKIANLTQNAIPPDNTKIIVTDPKQLQISDRLIDIFTSYASTIIQVTTEDASPNAVTAKIPREMVLDLSSLFSSFSTRNYPESANMQLIFSGLLSTSSDLSLVDFTRGVWRQFDRAFSELKVKECDVNKLSAALRAMTLPLTSDVTTQGSDALLDSAIAVAGDSSTADVVVDAEFKNQYADLVDTPTPVEEVLETVLDENAATVGNTPNESPTNKIKFDPSATAENVPVVDADAPGEILAEAKDGLKALFSSTTLLTPLRKLKELAIRTDNDGKPIVTDWGFETFADVFAQWFPSQTPPTTPEFLNGRLFVERANLEIDPAVDLDKSLLEQDHSLVLAADSTPTTALLRTNFNSTKPICIQTGDIESFIEKLSISRSSMDIKFRGLRSGKVYSVPQALSLSSGLKSLWSKMKNIKLPSPAHVSAATTILASGLGTIGSLTGSAGLQKASNVMAGFAEGISLFGRPLSSDSSNFSTVATLDANPDAKIARHALAIVPALTDAGVARLERDTNSAQDTRLKLLSLTRDINSSYAGISSTSVIPLGARAFNTYTASQPTNTLTPISTEEVNRLKKRVASKLRFKSKMS